MGYNQTIRQDQVENLSTDYTQVTDLVYYPKWTKITFGFADFSISGLTKTFTLYQPEEFEVHLATVIRIATAFSGGIIATYTISEGQKTLIDIMPATNAQIVTNTPVFPWASNVISPAELGTATPSPITLTAVSTVDTLDNANAGSGIAYILTTKLLSVV